MTPLLLALPWLALFLFVVLAVRIPTELPPAERPLDAPAPLVSVIVPARNERLTIAGCLASLTASGYADFEIVVVDDRSEDDTRALASAVPAGNARRFVIVDGEELPDGWIGKPWACWQGARVAAGDLLLFTDADTTHGRDLLARAVAGLREERADLLTIVGTQRMDTFWERLVQPHIFLLMVCRFPSFERVARNPRWREAIANGQFMLFPRPSYEAIGGHAAVRDEVVEDLALAQHVKRAGLRLRIRGAERDFSTRMYRSLREIVDGWSKNVVMGGLQSFPPALRAVVPPAALLIGVALWIAPPLLLVGALAGFGPDAVLPWSATASALAAATLAWFGRRMGAPWLYGLLFPLGALVGVYIFLRSWTRGRSVEWKGRRYVLPPASERV